MQTSPSAGIGPIECSRRKIKLKPAINMPARGGNSQAFEPLARTFSARNPQGRGIDVFPDPHPVRLFESRGSCHAPSTNAVPSCCRALHPSYEPPRSLLRPQFELSWSYSKKSTAKRIPSAGIQARVSANRSALPIASASPSKRASLHVNSGKCWNNLGLHI